jgi:hypothetical protein
MPTTAPAQWVHSSVLETTIELDDSTAKAVLLVANIFIHTDKWKSAK